MRNYFNLSLSDKIRLGIIGECRSKEELTLPSYMWEECDRLRSGYDNTGCKITPEEAIEKLDSIIPR
jgi:hypothetical protein